MSILQDAARTECGRVQASEREKYGLLRGDWGAQKLSRPAPPGPCRRGRDATNLRVWDSSTLIEQLTEARDSELGGMPACPSWEKGQRSAAPPKLARPVPQLSLKLCPRALSLQPGSPLVLWLLLTYADFSLSLS